MAEQTEVAETPERLTDEDIGAQCQRIERSLGEGFTVDWTKTGRKPGREPGHLVDVEAPDGATRRFRPRQATRAALFDYLQGAADFLEGYTEE